MSVCVCVRGGLWVRQSQPLLLSLSLSPCIPPSICNHPPLPTCSSLSSSGFGVTVYPAVEPIRNKSADFLCEKLDFLCEKLQNRFWLWLFRYKSLKCFKLFPLRSEAHNKFQMEPFYSVEYRAYLKGFEASP